MKTIETKNNNGIKIFAATIENTALEQIETLGNFDAYNDSKIRIMPDCHAGAGCTIGTTMTIKDKITPNLVGVDIGCGMLTIELNQKEIDLELLDSVIGEHIPNGFNVHSEQQVDFNFDEIKCNKELNVNRASLALGSLGGGNHFVEVGKNSKDDLFLVIHSGSRNIGLQVAKYYQAIALKNATAIDNSDLIKRLKAEGREKEIASELKKLKKPKANKDLAYLIGNDFDDYMHDMKIMQKYAVLNRRTMANIILDRAEITERSSFETIHNYIDFNRMILRKGAVSAEKGEVLLIPINMRDGSIIAIGKGNEDWNYSAPHGAGRLMSRTKAKENLDLSEFENQMKEIYSTSVVASTLDEAPNAYKSIDEIIEAIGDTVEIIDVIEPIYNFKLQKDWCITVEHNLPTII